MGLQIKPYAAQILPYCHKCEAFIHVNDAVFCPFCGNRMERKEMCVVTGKDKEGDGIQPLI